jgi:hypothetical protein
VYVNKSYMLEDIHGVRVESKGVYVICDNGYHRWKCLQPPMKVSSVREEILYSKWLESTRKDVECTFGILKARFRILKNPIILNKQYEIDNMFVTCCIIHNMLLEYDQLDRVFDEKVVDGDTLSSVMDSSHSDVVRNFIIRCANTVGESRVGNVNFHTNTTVHYVNPNDDVVEVESGFYNLRDKLVVNFNQQWKNHKVEWLTRQQK